LSPPVAQLVELPSYVTCDLERVQSLVRERSVMGSIVYLKVPIGRNVMLFFCCQRGETRKPIPSHKTKYHKGMQLVDHIETAFWSLGALFTGYRGQKYIRAANKIDATPVETSEQIHERLKKHGDEDTVICTGKAQYVGDDRHEFLNPETIAMRINNEHHFFCEWTFRDTPLFYLGV